jgi:hypothetical protein
MVSRMLGQTRNGSRRSAVLSFKFAGTALVGSLTMALVSALAPPQAQIAVLGSFISILAGLFLAYAEQDEEREKRRSELFEHLKLPIELAPEDELFQQYVTIAEALSGIAKQEDPVLRQFALMKLSSIGGQVQSLARGTVVFSNTETWRVVYEQILQSPGLTSYHSVAWVKTADYWQDQPGRQSMRLNFEMVRRGLRIDRIVILRDTLWPKGHALPSAEILPWIEEQNDQGIWMSLVRESELGTEPDLLCDLGVYDERAAGIQELDDRSRTLRFILHFDQPNIRHARERWDRLLLYADSYADLVDRSNGGR